MTDLATRRAGMLARLMPPAAVCAVVAQAGIAVTGSVVRVTGSGLGCPDWPTCFPTSLVPDPHQDVALLHQWVEFGNRLFVGVVSVVALTCLAAALAVRPRRRRLVVLAAAMPAGVAAQAVIGGATVLLGLAWWTVAVHFLVSMILVWLAVLLVDASREPDVAPPAPPAPARRWADLAALVLAALLAAGTMVTAAGPHAGDADTPRLGLGVPLLAHVHATLLVGYLAVLAALGLALRGSGAAHVGRRYRLLLAAVAAQGALGVVQYRLGVPEVLVSLHVLGASLVTAASAAMWSATRPAPVRPPPVGSPAPAR